MTLWLPLAATIVVALVLGFAADRSLARQARDRGTYWTRVLLIALSVLPLLVFASWLLQAFAARWWRSGIHLMPDLSFAQSTAMHVVALALPVAIWTLTLTGVAFTRIADPHQGRWLAGAVGLQQSRRWVLLMPGVPLLLLAGFAAERISALEPAADYPAALWSLLVVTLVNLLFIALSKGQSEPAAAVPAPVRATPRLPSWPEALEARGIGVTLLQHYGPEPQPGPVPTRAPPPCIAVRPELAERRIADALLEAVVKGTGNRLVMAPDDCGQIECIALHAERQITRGNAVALVVVPSRPEAFREGLLRWLPDAASAALLASDLQADSPAFVWIADAKTLSDRLIPLLEANPALLGRIGSLVWWDLHLYSGVLAANFWAISHRFQRLLERRGRHQLRHLAFVRGAPMPDTQLTAFLKLCLPPGFPAPTQTIIDAGCVRKTAVYLLTACTSSADAGRPAQRGAGAVRRPCIDSALAAARASCEAGWPTHLQAPAHLDLQVVEQVRREALGDTRPGACLLPDPVAAGARILEVDAGNVLALPEIIAQTGRCAPVEPLLHVGLAPAFGNPYVDYLLGRLSAEPQVLARHKRRMVAAQPQPGVIKRHLLLALNELPATLTDLNQTFRWEQPAAIKTTLRHLAEQNQILRRDVRYLVEAQRQEDRLEVEVEYRSVLSRGRAPPLTTIGTRLVDVFHPGEDPIMRIDPERATIDAYPFRVFLSEGRRYRIRQWESLAAITRDDGTLRIDCRREDVAVKTWRIFSAHLSNTRSLAGSTDLQIVGRRLTRTLTTTVYEERVSGYLEYIQNHETGQWAAGETVRLPGMIRSAPLPTNGLLLNIPQSAVAGYPLGLHSLAQAVRHVFAVHVGVAEDAVAILPFKGNLLDERAAWGLMIVDLYPGGIGLMASIDQDPALLVHLLELTRDWLGACPCRREGGCERCIQSPLALSAVADTITMRLSRGDALGVLEQILRL